MENMIPIEPLEAALPPTELIDLTTTATNTQISSCVQKFYSNANIFITGGTGFLGKLLVEKLLRSCTDIQTIYLLIRNKKGKDMHTRVDEMFDDPIFDRLKQENSKFRHKVVGIAGDCSITGLGISIRDRQRLLQDVNIVFHVAATVRFDEHIRLAMAINVHATREVIELSKQMTNLKTVIHVSTAYSNCNVQKIEETFYNAPINVDDLENMILKLSDDELQEITPRIIGQWPNTYTFTKALAEAEVANNCKGLRVGVFRPAIVVSTYKEPLVAWINNLYGPNGVVAGVCKGILRTLHCHNNITANIVPADMCVNSLICSAWDVYNSPASRSKEDVPIYNYVTSAEKPLTWYEFHSLNLLFYKNNPFTEVYWTLSFRTVKNRVLNLFYFILLHFVPGVIMDVILTVLGKKPQMVTMYKKILKFTDVISPFCTQEWEFTNHNVQNLWKKIDNHGRSVFFFNMAEIDWLLYFRNYVKGMRVYLFHDPLSNVEAAKRKYKRFEMLHFALKGVLHFVLIYALWSILSMATSSITSNISSLR